MALLYAQLQIHYDATNATTRNDKSRSLCSSFSSQHRRQQFAYNDFMFSLSLSLDRN
jgi:hypothetical protein